MKSENKGLLCRYLLIIFLTGVFFAAGLFFFDRMVTPEGEAEMLYDEPRNTIDVLILGGSQSMCALNTTEIYSQTGLTTYSFTTWSQPVWVSYYYLKEALKTQNPQVVILDVFGSFYENTYMTGVDVDLVSDDYAALLRPSVNLVQLNLARHRVQVTKKPWYEYLNIAKYHSRITELTADSFLKMIRDDTTQSKGFGPFYTTESFEGYICPQTDEAKALYPYAEEYLQKIIALCKKEKIHLIFTKMPHIADENDIAVLNSVSRIAQDAKIPMLDFCSNNNLSLDYSEDFADHGHVNFRGMKKVSHAVEEYLKALGLKGTKDKKTISRWDKDAESEKNDAAEMEVRLSRSFSEIVENAQNLDSAIIVVKQDNGMLSEIDYEKSEDLFMGTVFSLPAEKLKQESVLLYVNEKLYSGTEALQWCNENGITVSVGEKACIQYQQQEYSFARQGWNVAIWNNNTKSFYHKVFFARDYDYELYTD